MISALRSFERCKESATYKREYVSVELISINLSQSVRTARVDFQNTIVDQLYRQLSRSSDWNDLIIIAMNQQHRLVDGLQICGIIYFRELMNAVIMRLYSSLHPLQPECLLEPFISCDALSIKAVERYCQILK